MDILLARVTSQAMNHAIRTGITITSGFAIDQCARLLKTEHGQEHDELANLHRRLHDKTRIISPAIDMIELIAARGNTSLESAVSLTKSIRWDIQALGERISAAVGEEDQVGAGRSKTRAQTQRQAEIQHIIRDMKQLLARIEDAVPLINLAITTSGVNLSTNLPASVSPSRLLQASMFLNAGDSQYGSKPARAVQIGPTFTLSMYMMLFCGHSQQAQDEAGLRTTIWKEVIHKARVKLVRVPLDKIQDFPFDLPPSDPLHLGSSSASEFAYQICIIEDLDDGRYHTLEDNAEPLHVDDVASAGLCHFIPIHEVSRIFYADTGKVLNIGSVDEPNNPVLLIKRDVNAIPPRRKMGKNELDNDSSLSPSPNSSDTEEAELSAQLHRDMEDESDKSKTIPSNIWRLDPNLDPEWVAFEVYQAESSDTDSASEDEDESASGHLASRSLAEPALRSALSALHLSTPPPDASHPGLVSSRRTEPLSPHPQRPSPQALPLVQIQTRLSLLEMLIRLTSLQQFQQASHLTITDELLNYFLEDASTTGAAPHDAEARKRVRMEARARVGFDPYDESPIKRRGEDYQRHEAIHAQNYSVAETSPGDSTVRDRLPSEEYERGYDAAWADINSAARHGRGSVIASRENTPATPMSPVAFRSREQDSPSPLPDSTGIVAGKGSASRDQAKRLQDSRGRKASQRDIDIAGLATPPSTSPATASGLRASLMPEARVRADIESGRAKGFGSPLAHS